MKGQIRLREKAEKKRLQRQQAEEMMDLMLPPEPPKPIPRPKSILPPPDWRPTPLKAQGKIRLEEYTLKINKLKAAERQKLISDQKRLLKLKHRDIKQHGAFKCTISQCNMRFFSKSQQIEHTTQHQRMSFFSCEINSL